MDVIVELWGPTSREGGSNWIPIGKIDASSLDIDYLKNEALRIIENREIEDPTFPGKTWLSNTNTLRLRVVRNSKDAMKITLEDLI